MKILLDYDPISGNITDGAKHIGCDTGLSYLEHKQKNSGYGIKEIIKQKNSGYGIEEIIKLKNAGFTADEIIQIKKSGLEN